MDVLIVDDTPYILQFITDLVVQHGHSVTPCSSGELALQALAQKSFPLVLVDWEMPGIKGPEVIRHIRSMSDGEACYVLTVTARNDAAAIQAALEAGANDYLIKPFDVDLFELRLRIAESQSRIMVERLQSQRETARYMTQLARSNEDLLSILNRICIGTLLTDRNGHVSFINRIAATFLSLDQQQSIGRRWSDALPLSDDDRHKLEETLGLPEEKRQRLAFHLRGDDGHQRWADVIVQNDPRGNDGHLFMFLDMSEVHSLREQLNGTNTFQELVGRSRPMALLYQQIREIAPTDITVLIDGETGAGKEMVARAIHDASQRSDKPFIAVNCAGLTDSLLTSQLFGHAKGAFTGAIKDKKGLFEEANGGTLFLDEIGEISMAMQSALLRVLQEREIVRVGENLPRKVNVRIISATNRDLEQEVVRGNFRADLMYRIRVAHLRLPPLRERLEDIPLLVNRFIDRFRAATGKEVREISQDALRALTEYPWPGNVRELENVIEVAAVRSKGSVIQRHDLSPLLQHGAFLSHGGAGLPPAMPPSGEGERQRILAALQQHRGNRRKAAEALGISRATLYRRLEQLGIDQ